MTWESSLDPSAGTGDRPWTVLRITPDQYSGSETLIGAAINAKTGELIDAAMGKPAVEMSFPSGVIEQGSWTVITRIWHPAGNQTGRTQMDRASEQVRNEGSILMMSTGRSRVVASCCAGIIRRQKLTALQFNSVSLLPPGWVNRCAVRFFNTLQKNKVLSGKPGFKDGYIPLFGP